ncbi:MAG: type II secretion system protein GspC [Desulfobacterales bacterium]|nr:type II secretion system protein GspC [Desulfobacterales bacterium]
MNRLLLYINICLVVTVFAMGGRVVYTATRPLPPLPTPTVQETSVTAPAGKDPMKPLAAYEVIARRDLFKTIKIETEKKPDMNVDALTETRLNLKLWGTIAGDAERTYAVIEDPKIRQQQLYRVGDMIQTAKVKMILRERVVLNVDGRDEVLVIQDSEKSGPADRQAKPTNTPSPRPSAELPQTQQITLDPETAKALSTKPEDLMKQVRARLHMENGQPAGILLSGIRPNSVFRKMGLQSGDIITGFDDTVIETPESLPAILEQISSASTLSLQVKRRGQPMTLNVQME